MSSPDVVKTGDPLMPGRRGVSVTSSIVHVSIRVMVPVWSDACIIYTEDPIMVGSTLRTRGDHVDASGRGVVAIARSPLKSQILFIGAIVGLFDLVWVA